MPVVAGFGDNVIDRFLDRGVDYPGGNCVNFAVFAQQRGADASYLGVFGSDDDGEYIRSVLTSLAIDVSRSVVRRGETGYAEVEVIDGERHFRGGNLGGVTTAEPLILHEGDLNHLSSYSLVHSSVYSNSESELPKLAGLGPLVSYDLSSEDKYRSSRYLERVAPYVDLALVSCSNLTESETEHDLVTIASHGVGLALGTRGTAGAILFDGRVFHRIDAVPIADPTFIKDTMGCGDAFLAAFSVEMLRAGWSSNRTVDDSAVMRALQEASTFAMQRCLVEGAFGHGRVRAPASGEFGVS